MRNYFILLLMLSLAICGCETETVTRVPKQADGYKPIYADPALAKEVRYEAAKSVSVAGKIYYKNGFIYQVDEGTGIHIVRAVNPSQASRIGFISIKGCSEIAITGNYLFTNNLTDLITVDISDLSQPKVVKRIANAFTLINFELPPERGFFECIDNNKGVVVGWKKETLRSPKCSNF